MFAHFCFKGRLCSESVCCQLKKCQQQHGFSDAILQIYLKFNILHIWDAGRTYGHRQAFLRQQGAQWDCQVCTIVRVCEGPKEECSMQSRFCRPLFLVLVYPARRSRMGCRMATWCMHAGRSLYPNTNLDRREAAVHPSLHFICSCAVPCISLAALATMCNCAQPAHCTICTGQCAW